MSVTAHATATGRGLSRRNAEDSLFIVEQIQESEVVLASLTFAREHSKRRAYLLQQDGICSKYALRSCSLLQPAASDRCMRSRT